MKCVNVQYRSHQDGCPKRESVDWGSNPFMPFAPPTDPPRLLQGLTTPSLLVGTQYIMYGRVMCVISDRQHDRYILHNLNLIINQHLFHYEVYAVPHAFAVFHHVHSCQSTCTVQINGYLIWFY